MAYYLAYNPSLNNALVGVTDSVIIEQAGLVVIHSEDDMPDLSRFMWNSATLEFVPLFKKTLIKREFLKRFTAEEYGNVRAAAASNSTVDYYWNLFILAEEIVMEESDTINGIHLLEQAGLIGPGRAQEIIGL